MVEHYIAGTMKNCSHLSAHSVYTMHQLTVIQLSHIHMVHVFLLFSCNLPFWQNHQDILGAAVITGVEGTWLFNTLSTIVVI